MKRLGVISSVLLVLLTVSADTYASGLGFEAELSGAQSVPTPGPGLIEESDVEVNFDEGFTQVEVEFEVEGGTNVVAAHFHCAVPAETGPVAFGLFSPGPLVFDGEIAEGVLTNADFSGGDCLPTIGQPVSNIVALALAMREGLIYINVHTTDNGSGEVRGQLLEVPRRVRPDR